MAASLAPALVAWCPVAFALDPTLDLSQYARATWKVRDGFAGGRRIAAIAQTVDGYMWFGTDGGLFRFDGVATTEWRPPSGEALPSRWIISALGTRDGALWIGTFEGLARWKDGRLTTYPAMAGHIVDALLEDREGTVWAGTQKAARGALLCAIREENAQCEGADDRFGRAIGALHEDTRGRLWVASAKGLWRWKPGPPLNIALPAPGNFQNLAEDDRGNLLVALPQGIVRIVDDKPTPVTPAWLPPGGRADKLLRDRDGALWVTTYEHGLLHVRDERGDSLGRADGVTNHPRGRMFEDREGNVWVVVDTAIEQFSNPVVAPFDWRQGLADRIVSSIAKGRDGSLWLNTLVGLHRWRDARLTLYRNRISLPARVEGTFPREIPIVVIPGLPESYASLLADRRGRIWIGAIPAVGYLENERFVRVARIPGGLIDAMAEGDDGSVWVAQREHGLYRWAEGRGVEHIRWAELDPDNPGLRLAPDKRGGVWIGTIQGALFHWSEGRVLEKYGAAEGIAKGRISFLRLEQDGALWIGTSGGLSRLKDGRISTLTRENGLPCDAVDWMIEDAVDSLWLVMECGLARIARAEIDAWVAAADRRESESRQVRTSALLGPSEGVLQVAARGTATPHAALSPLGRLWLAGTGVDGALIVDPSRLRPNSVPPPVHVERLTADHESFDAPAGLLRLPPRVRDLQIKYTALSFVAPGSVLFRYKLEGRDRDWIDAGTRRQVFYTDLPPGPYRFRVIAANNSGVWNEQGATLDFSIAPAYWQTNWFRAACVAAVLLALWALYQLRLHQIAQRFTARLEERVGERTRIARDLHDTMLQSFQGLLLRFQTVHEMLPARPSAAKVVLGSAIDQTAQAITEGRNAVQGLRASTAEGNDLAPALRSLGEELAYEWRKDKPAAMSLAVEGSARTLQPIVRDEVYRIVAEALRNAFRHAGAREIEVELRYDARQLRLRIRDDGKGLAPEYLMAKGREGHFGLHGMRERAKLMGGKLTVWTAPGSGTEIELTIPGTYAYADAAPRRWWPDKLSRKSAESDS